MFMLNSFVFALSRINQIGKFSHQNISRLYSGESNYLFDSYPTLYGKIPWLPIVQSPTPIEELPSPAEKNRVRLFVKRDDLTSALYGGHKVRKLEYLFAEAILNEAKAIVATGRIGAGQALAIALHGRELKFAVDLSLFEQPITKHVRDNLLGIIQTGARIQYSHSLLGCLWNAKKSLSEWNKQGFIPYFIASGINTHTSNLGYVNAGLELAQQIKDAVLPEPDRIFVPAGSCGVAAGLLIALKLAKLRSRLVAVQIVNSFFPSKLLITAYAKGIIKYLRRIDESVPDVRIGLNDVEVITDYFGEGYGVPTEAGERAILWAAPHIRLESTYTGKTLAACLDYCRTKGQDQTILFWNTFNSASFEKAKVEHPLMANSDIFV
jgi:1-aminocyclopropane-1-carboxylate deaminase/D-cysteine desulfhydrase-like pyridoxal-dependent ACC family enzyme